MSESLNRKTKTDIVVYFDKGNYVCVSNCTPQDVDDIENGITGGATFKVTYTVSRHLVQSVWINPHNVTNVSVTTDYVKEEGDFLDYIKDFDG